MDNDDGARPDDRNLVFLRRLVTVLTATMILGVLTIVVLLVIRLQTPPPPSLPDRLTLPPGVTAEAVTFGGTWIAVVTGDDRILILDRGTGDVLQDIAITLPE